MPVNIIDTLKPKNNGSFPVVEAVDVAVASDLRLPEALAAKADTSALASTDALVATKANASDVATATAELQGEIDQIVISASAESVVAPEVAAARVDIDGNSYTTLKSRLDADAHSTTDIMSKLRADNIIDVTEMVEVLGNYTIAPNGYVTANNSYTAYIYALNGVRNIYVYGNVIGYFTSKPTAGSTTYNEQRDTNSGDKTVDESVKYVLVCVTEGTNHTLYASCAKIAERVDTAQNDVDALSEKLLDEKIILIQPTVSETIGHYTVASNGYINPNEYYDAYIVELNGLQQIKTDKVQVAGFFASLPVYPYNQVTTVDGTRYTPGGLPHTFNVPTGARYAVINSFVDSGEPVCVNVDTGNSVPDRVDYNEESIAEISEIKNQYTAYDLSNATKVTGKFIMFNKSIVEASALNYYIIPIEASTKYAVSGYSYSQAVLFALLDENGDVLSVYPASKPSETTEYTRIEVNTSNPQAVYIAVNDLARGELPISPVVETFTTGRMIKDSALPSSFTGNYMPNDILNDYLCTAGDSITEGIGIEGGSSMPINQRPTYGKLAADYYSMRYINIAQSGRTMADIKVNGVTRNGFAVDRYTLVPETATHLTIWFGWNDAAYGPNSMRDDYCVATYGELYSNCTAEQKAEADAHADWQATFLGAIDSDNTKTWSGAWNFVLNYFTLSLSIPHLGVVIPYLAPTAYCISLRERLIEICKRYGVSYFDVANPHDCPSIGWGENDALANASGLKSLYTADGTHPNADGYKRIAPAYIDFIHRI